MLKTGKFLIATPTIIGDFNFQRSCVLMVDIKQSGAVGFIVNKKLEYTLDELMDTVSTPFSVYYWGPVEPENLFFIHKFGSLIPNSFHIRDNLFWSGNFESIIGLIESGKLAEQEIRFFLGYSGWSEGQLENEIQEDSWVISDKIKPEDWIVHHSEDLWKNQMRALGGKYLLWSNAPENPMSN